LKEKRIDVNPPVLTEKEFGNRKFDKEVNKVWERIIPSINIEIYVRVLLS